MRGRPGTVSACHPGRAVALASWRAQPLATGATRLRPDRSLLRAHWIKRFTTMAVPRCCPGFSTVFATVAHSKRSLATDNALYTFFRHPALTAAP